MKKYFLLLFISMLMLGVNAGDGNGKGKGKSHEKNEKAKHHDDEWYDDDDNNYKSKDKVKASKNIPKKVRKAFEEDFPNARNTSWTKSRGDWTANFKTKFAWRTATYHANGERISTGQSRIPQQYPTRGEKPGKNEEDGSVWDIIKKRIPRPDVATN